MKEKHYYYEHRRHGGLLDMRVPLDEEEEQEWRRLTDEEYDRAYTLAWNQSLAFGY